MLTQPRRPQSQNSAAAEPAAPSACSALPAPRPPRQQAPALIGRAPPLGRGDQDVCLLYTSPSPRD
eukprot:8338569-Alexandrium_andersonii.AAC.1